MSETISLKDLNEAINRLQKGAQVVSIRYGDLQVTYAQNNLSDLLRLRQQLKAEKATRIQRRQVIHTTKGL